MIAAPILIPFDELDLIEAREYLRVSTDRSGRVRSNEEQHDENRPALEVAMRGRAVSWGAPYEDVGSASKYQRKRRADFDRLIADLTHGTFGARVLVLWEGSRGSRKVSEWAAMLEHVARLGVRIWVTMDRRLYDPSTPRDWKALMEDAVDHEYEVRKTSARVLRSVNANGEVGAYGGGRRPFGYNADGMSKNDDEARTIKRCARWAIAGKSARWIAGAINDEGVLTTAGNPWTSGTLKRMLTSPRIMGRTPKGAPAQWPAIIDEATHRRVVATLSTRSPVGRRARTSWLLTGLLRCELCGESLTSSTDTKGTRRYFCRKGVGFRGCGRLAIRAADLEELLGDLASERLADVDARRSAIGGPDDGDELRELDQIAARRVELGDDYAAGRISRETKNADAAALDRHQKRVEAALAAKVREHSPLDFVATEAFVGRAWDELTVDDQRHVLDALIDHVTVAPASVRGSKTFEVERVTSPGRIVWRV